MVNCYKCKKLVAVLELGSKVKSGTIMICQECNNPKPSDVSGLEDLMNMFGMNPSKN